MAFFSECELTMAGNRKPHVRRAWSFTDRHIVRDEYRSDGAVVLAARLGRTVGQVKAMAMRLRVCRPNHAPYRWSAERRLRFAAVYRRSPAAAASQFGLTRKSANTYASLWRMVNKKKWTAKEVELVRDLWPRRMDDELVERTQRTIGAICQKAYSLGLRRPAIHEWTKGTFKPEGASHARVIEEEGRSTGAHRRPR